MQGTDTEVEARIGALAERQIAGIVVELGAILRTVPEAAIRICDRLGIPLIALHFPVRFVEVTEVIHTAIVGKELSVTRWQAELHRRLSDLALGGGRIKDLLDEVAERLGNPVVLEHDGGGIAYSAGRPRPEREILGAWESFIEKLPGGSETLVHRLPDVEGEPSGRLVAIALDQPFQQRKDEVTLECAGTFIALAYVRDPQQHSLYSTIDGGILSAVVRGDLDGAGAAAMPGRLGGRQPCSQRTRRSRLFRRHGP